MASFNRADYEKLVELARWLYAQDLGPRGEQKAKELFELCESVIGQQSPPLEYWK
jgi:hypothetical protein